MDEKILVILIAYVIVPAILCTICLIAYIIRNKRNGEKDFVDEVGVDAGPLVGLAIFMILLAIIKLVIKW